MSYIRNLLVAVACLTLFSASTKGATLTWTGGGDGTSFTDVANWSGTPTGGVIDKANIVDDHVINDAAAMISETGSHVINGGSISLAAGEILRPDFQGVSGGPLNVSGGVIRQWFLSAGATVSIGGTGEVELFGAGGAINNGGGDVTVDLTSPTSKFTFLQKTAGEVVGQYLGDIFVGGAASVFGTDPLVLEAGDNAFIVENAASGADNVSVFGVAIVPEPTSALLSFLPVAWLAVVRRRTVVSVQ